MAKVLILDIETSPIVCYTWGLWDQNPGLDMMKEDWYILAWSAKWLDGDEVFYNDLRSARDKKTDKSILPPLWHLLNRADVVVTQNGKSFDVKKINARFILNGMKPPSSFRQIDTKVLAKKHFGFTSNSLEYMSKRLCKMYRKLKHKRFPGFELWKECMKGSLLAWKEMEVYNRFDVLATEELYKRLAPWDNSSDFSSMNGGQMTCSCGSTVFTPNGFKYTAAGKYQRLKCVICGSEAKSKKNLLRRAK